METSPVTDLSSPGTQFWFDVNRSPFFRLDAQNVINVVGARQLNSLRNTSLLDICLGCGNIIEPHYHPNAAELIYCIAGAAKVSILNPFTRQITEYAITPEQVVNVPRAWWHYEYATTDGTHLLAVFDAPNPEVILGSDLLTLTPPRIFAQAYCIDEAAWKQAVAPVVPGTVIGPRSAGAGEMPGGAAQPLPSAPAAHAPWMQAFPGFGWPGPYGLY
jgi:quercetin dioxygenase-like cupin family protein